MSAERHLARAEAVADGVSFTLFVQRPEGEKVMLEATIPRETAAILANELITAIGPLQTLSFYQSRPQALHPHEYGE